MRCLEDCEASRFAHVQRQDVKVLMPEVSLFDKIEPLSVRLPSFSRRVIHNFRMSRRAAEGVWDGVVGAGTPG